MSRIGIGGSGLGDHPGGGPLEDMTDEASEYSWGSGLTPPGLDAAPPSESGRYKRLTPPEHLPRIGKSRN